MKKTLLIMLLSIFLIPEIKVNAEVDSCYNSYLIDITSESWAYGSSYYNVSTDTWKSTSTSRNFAYLKYLFKVSPGKTYYFKFFDLTTSEDFTSGTPYKYYDSELNMFTTHDSTKSYDSINNQLIVTIPESIENISYTSFSFYIYGSDFESLKASPIAFADFDLSTCPPKEDFKPEINPDTTLDSFYSLYLDKIKSLASYSLENKFLLGAIGIILLFAILELILYLFNKGGYRR